MNTDELILGLAAQPPAPPLRPGRMALAMGVAIVVPAVVFLGVLGLRLWAPRVLGPSTVQDFAHDPLVVLDPSAEPIVLVPLRWADSHAR